MAKAKRTSRMDKICDAVSEHESILKGLSEMMTRSHVKHVELRNAVTELTEECNTVFAQRTSALSAIEELTKRVAEQERSAQAATEALKHELINKGLNLEDKVMGLLDQVFERLDRLDNGKPSPETKLPRIGEPCVILVGAPWQGFKVHGPFPNHDRACDYQANYLTEQDFWWVLPLKKL